MSFTSTKILELGSCAFRQPKAESHCRFLHGYRLTAKFWFKANQLDENNWVVDFGSLDHLKKLLKKQFDHTTVIDKNDPYIESFQGLDGAGVLDLRIMDGVGIEKFAEYCFKASNDFISEQSEGRCWVDNVEVFEHENNSAIYTENMVTTMRFANHTEEDNG
jgi:6-pyruvoyltetrahydropterin/6-carboxytetrahydropterin synthase